MMTVQFELSDEDGERLSQLAATQAAFVSEVVQRWVLERLAQAEHRAAGNGTPPQR